MNHWDHLLSVMQSGNDKIAAEYLRSNPKFAADREAQDKFLFLAVRKGCVESIQTLASMGANIDQKPQGRSLVRWAPRGRDDVKRVLRSIKSSSTIASAMDSHDEPSSAPVHSSMTL